MTLGELTYADLVALQGSIPESVGDQTEWVMSWPAYWGIRNALARADYRENRDAVRAEIAARPIPDRPLQFIA